MGTRAQITFTNVSQQGEPLQSWQFYQHWDGYPEGMATSLYRMVCYGAHKSGLHASFLGGNPETVELMPQNEDDWGPEYRYTVSVAHNQEPQIAYTHENGNSSPALLPPKY